MRSTACLVLAAGLLVPSTVRSQEPPARETKSVPRAVLSSLLLPGMGELYAGDYGTGKYFTIAEGVLLVTLLGVDRYGTWLQDDARLYAAQHAGFATTGKSDQYYTDVSNFNSVRDYNEQVLRDRDPFKLYDEASSDRWWWDTPANRMLFRDKRVEADAMFNNTRFVVAAIAVNHLVSAINAARLAIAHNRDLEEPSSLDIRARVLGGLTSPHGVMLSFTKTF